MNTSKLRVEKKTTEQGRGSYTNMFGFELHSICFSFVDFGRGVILTGTKSFKFPS